MKAPLVAVLVVIVTAVAVGAYLSLSSHPTSQSSSITTTQSSTIPTSTQTPTTQSTTRTTSTVPITNPTAQVSVSALTCTASSGLCVITLVNTGGTGVQATSCTINGLTGVFTPAGAQVPPGGKVDVSCSPSAGGAVPIPGFHVEGIVQLSNGASAHYTGSWA